LHVPALFLILIGTLNPNERLEINHVARAKIAVVATNCFGKIEQAAVDRQETLLGGLRPAPGEIPESPGVYKFRDARGRVTYVGKESTAPSKRSAAMLDAPPRLEPWRHKSPTTSDPSV